MVVNDYLSNQDRVISFISNFTSPTVIFFNGYLKENRPIQYPNLNEIFKTFFVNFKVPYLLTKNILLNEQNIKMIYISSIASLKLREKNYIYGYSKYLLEKNIQKLTEKLFNFKIWTDKYKNVSKSFKTSIFIRKRMQQKLSWTT